MKHKNPVAKFAHKFNKEKIIDTAIKLEEKSLTLVEEYELMLKDLHLDDFDLRDDYLGDEY